MSEDFGNDIITITDDEGNDYELEHLDTIELNNETYMVFADADSADEEEVEIVIFRVAEEDGEEIFEGIEDDELMEELYDMFMEKNDGGEE